MNFIEFMKSTFSAISNSTEIMERTFSMNSLKIEFHGMYFSTNFVDGWIPQKLWNVYFPRILWKPELHRICGKHLSSGLKISSCRWLHSWRRKPFTYAYLHLVCYYVFGIFGQPVDFAWLDALFFLFLFRPVLCIRTGTTHLSL